jgi:hypothetical protein
MYDAMAYHNLAWFLRHLIAPHNNPQHRAFPDRRRAREAATRRPSPVDEEGLRQLFEELEVEASRIEASWSRDLTEPSSREVDDVPHWEEDCETASTLWGGDDGEATAGRAAVQESTIGHGSWTIYGP